MVITGLSFRQLLVRSVAALLLGLAVSLPAAYLLITAQEGGSTGGTEPLGPGVGVSPVKVTPSGGAAAATEAEGGGLILSTLMTVIAEAGQVPPWVAVPEATVTVVPVAAAGGSAGVASAPAPGAGVIGTNVQVEGVDEGDIADISGDGGLVAVARGYEVLVHDIVVGGAPVSIEGPGGEAAALSFVDDRLLAIVWGGLKGAEPGLLPNHVELWIVNLENPREPVVAERHTVSGDYVALRVDNGRLLLVTDSTPSRGAPGTPWLDSVPLSDESLAILDPLPLRVIQVTLVEPGVAAESVVIAVGSDVRVVAGSGTLALAWSTPYDPEELGRRLLEAAISLGVDPERLREELNIGYYEFGAQALLALAMNDEWAREKAGQEFARIISVNPSSTVNYTTTLAFIGYEDGLQLLGKARVKGALLDQFAVNPLSEGLYVVATTIMEPRIVEVASHGPAEAPSTGTIVVTGDGLEGVVKVVYPDTGSGPAAAIYRAVYSLLLWASPKHNAVYVVSVDGEVVSGLEGFGEGLRLRAARLVGTTLYVSAYTQVDPIYVVDLSDPGSPRLLAELKMPGWSEYLHYLGNGLLLGVGFTDDGRNKVTLIDVSDPANPAVVDELVLKGARVLAAEDDYRAFMYDPETGRAFLVAASFTGKGVGVVVVEVAREGLEFAGFLEVEGALRVFAAGDRIIVAAENYVALYDRETLEPLLRALGAGG